MYTDFMQVLYIILYIVPFSVLRYYPFLSHLRISPGALCIVYGLILGAEAGLFVFLSRQAFWDVGWTQTLRLSFSALFAILSFVVIRVNFFKNLFVYLLMFAYGGLVNGLAHMAEAAVLSSYGAIPQYTIVNVAMLLQLLLTMPVAFWLLKEKFVPLLEVEHTDVWNYIWLIPAMFILFALLFSVDLSAVAVKNWRFHAIRCLVIAGVFFSSFIVMKIVEQARSTAALAENMRMTQKLFEVQSHHYKMVAEHMNETKAVRHDMHHHILVMQAYLQNRQLTELEKYLQQYQAALHGGMPQAICGHPIVNAILSHYQLVAERLQIQFTVEVEMPENWGVEDLDLCVVLGNVLENAVEACQRVKDGERQMSLFIKRKGNMVVMTMVNSYFGEVRPAADFSFFSSKRAGNVKGFGLRNIQGVIDKYQGVMDVTYSATRFQTAIVLNQQRGQQGARE